MTDSNGVEKAPLLSIVVPVYNTEKYLRQCVDSILGQSFRDFEVILVDDGSPDGSGAICDGYASADARVRVIHKKNGGLVSARKAGMAECSGVYVLNVDSDDYIAPDHLEKIAQAITDHHPDVVLFGMIQFSGDTEEPLVNRIPVGLYTGKRMEVIRSNLICDSTGMQSILYNLCAAAVTRERYTVHQNAVVEHISRGEDLVVTTPLLAGCDSVYVLDYCGYYYRSNPTSIMNTFRKDEPEQMKAVASYLSEVMPEAYGNQIDLYVSTHYFDFLDRAMLTMSYREYRDLIRETADTQIRGHLRRAKCRGNVTVMLIVELLRWGRYDLLWLLRKIKKRQA